MQIKTLLVYLTLIAGYWILNRTDNYQNIFIIEIQFGLENENSFYNNNSLFLSINDTILKYNNLLLNPDTILIIN